MRTKGLARLRSSQRRGCDRLSKKVGIDNFAGELVSLLQEYTEEVTEGMEEVKGKVAKEGAKSLKQTSPVGRRSRKKYKDGWRAKKVGTAWVVHRSEERRVGKERRSEGGRC